MSETAVKSTKSTRRKKTVSSFKSTEARENYLANLAYELIEKKIKDGTASSQILCMLVGMKSEKSQLENEKLRSDLDVANAKIKNLEKQTSSEELMEKALAAFKSYSGKVDEKDEDDYEDD